MTIAIETHDENWNPIRGCARVSPGCDNCYAERYAARLAKMSRTGYEGIATMTKAGPRWTREVRFAPSVLDKPRHWVKPRMVFVNSMSDLFQEAVRHADLREIFRVMADTPQHTYQILTKRPEVMLRRLKYLAGSDPFMNLPLPNVWLGVSVEDQQRAEERIPILLETPAAVCWISAEPLLGPIDLELARFDRLVPRLIDGLDWVVTGGESGPGARPANPFWFRILRNQCRNAGVPFFFKQWGGPIRKARPALLDGVIHHAYPERINAPVAL